MGFQYSELPVALGRYCREHPYIIALAATAILIVAGVFFITHEIHTPEAGTAFTWQTSSGLPASPQYSSGFITGSSSPSFTGQGENVPFPQLAAGTPSSTQTAASGLDALLLQLSRQSNVRVTSSTSDNIAGIIANAYSFIPSGLIATSSFINSNDAEITQTQKALYDYGNAAGAIIGRFQGLHQDAVQVMQDQAADRNDPTKAANLRLLGADLAAVGKTMLKISNIPTPIVTYNAALAATYEDAGAKLSAIADAGTDAQQVAAITTYDTAVDALTKNYIALAEYLAAANVTFSSGDAGRVFSFTPASI